MYEGADTAKHRYAKHKEFKVGAYLITSITPIMAGNVEHTNSRLTMCAETLVLAQAKMQSLTPVHLHLVSDSVKPIFPCGVCRQYMSEWPKLKVTVYSADGSKKVTKTAKQLLPNPFERGTLAA